MNTVQIIGVCLIAAGALYFAGLFAYGKLKNYKPSPALTVVSSDAPAPIGISEYLALVELAAPTATAEVRWEYVAVGCTEADVLRNEVARLGKTSQVKVQT